jgi:hypothetical protein
LYTHRIDAQFLKKNSPKNYFQCVLRLRKLHVNVTKILFSELNNLDYVIIGQTFVDGQNRNVWCDSKRPFSDIKMFFDSRHITRYAHFSSVPSCFKLYYSSVLGLLMDDESRCILTLKNTFAKIFLCD